MKYVKEKDICQGSPSSSFGRHPVCPDEPDQLNQDLGHIAAMEQSQQEQLSIREHKKRLFLEKGKRKLQRQ